MKTPQRKPTSRSKPSSELADLRTRLAAADEALRAIRNGEVDTVVVAGKQGRQVFTLQGEELAYRELIESMNEGALTLAADKTILYANQCFARLVKCPLEQVIGSSFRRFLSPKDRPPFQTLLEKPDQAGSKIPVLLKAGDGLPVPVQISLCSLAKDGSSRPIIGLVVTDMTEARRTEDMLRSLTHRVVQAQEAERGRVALELHDHITQLLCALGYRTQALADMLSTRDVPAKTEAIKIHDQIGYAANEVERISRNLRPGVLHQLGLLAVLKEACTQFTKRTGVAIKLNCVELTAPLSAAAELALYRILQEALRNVEKHARARHVAVALSQQDAFVELVTTDDGVGFSQETVLAKRKGKRGLGLLGMRERAISVRGLLTVRSSPTDGTEIKVRIPLKPEPTSGTR